MPKLKTVVSVLMTASLLAAGGCGGGGGDSDGDKAEQVAEDYIGALNAKDEKRACELQIASSRKDGGCVLHSHGQIVPKSPKVESPDISGDRANVLVTGSGGSVTLNLAKEDGDWKVEEYQGQAR
jgi:hypothetical protein